MPTDTKPRKARGATKKAAKRTTAPRIPRAVRASGATAAGEETNGAKPKKDMKTPVRIGKYLDECRGDRGSRGLKPMTRRSPEKIEAAIAKLEAKLPDMTTMAELIARSRILELRQALVVAQANGASTSRAFFVEHAGAYAAQKGISYAAFREMGVAARVLKEAGIKP